MVFKFFKKKTNSENKIQQQQQSSPSSTTSPRAQNTSSSEQPVSPRNETQTPQQHLKKGLQGILNLASTDEDIFKKFTLLSHMRRKKQAGRFLVVNASAEAEKNRDMQRNLVKMRQQHDAFVQQYEQKKKQKIEKIKQKLALKRQLKQLSHDAHTPQDADLDNLISVLSAELETVEDRHQESSNAYDEICIEYMREKRKLRTVLRELRTIAKLLEDNQSRYDHAQMVRRFQIPETERLHIPPCPCLSTTNLFGFLYLYDNMIIFESAMMGAKVDKIKTSTLIGVRKSYLQIEGVDISVEIETNAGAQYVFIVPQGDKLDLLYSSLASYLHKA